ncbi:hypothetical protein BRM52_01025, partial [Xanthomonas oryzae pv. oryzae]
LRVTSSMLAVVSTASKRAAAVQTRSRCGSANAWLSQRSSVASDTPISRDSALADALSGGNNRATALSLIGDW